MSYQYNENKYYNFSNNKAININTQENINIVDLDDDLVIRLRRIYGKFNTQHYNPTCQETEYCLKEVFKISQELIKRELAKNDLGNKVFLKGPSWFILPAQVALKKVGFIIYTPFTRIFTKDDKGQNKIIFKNIYPIPEFQPELPTNNGEVQEYLEIPAKVTAISWQGKFDSPNHHEVIKFCQGNAYVREVESVENLKINILCLKTDNSSEVQVKPNSIITNKNNTFQLYSLEEFQAKHQSK